MLVLSKHLIWPQRVPADCAQDLGIAAWRADRCRGWPRPVSPSWSASSWSRDPDTCGHVSTEPVQLRPGERLMRPGGAGLPSHPRDQRRGQHKYVIMNEIMMIGILITGLWNQRNQTTCVQLRSKSSTIVHRLPPNVRCNHHFLELCHSVQLCRESPQSSQDDLPPSYSSLNLDEDAEDDSLLPEVCLLCEDKKSQLPPEYRDDAMSSEMFLQNVSRVANFRPNKWPLGVFPWEWYMSIWWLLVQYIQYIETFKVTPKVSTSLNVFNKTFQCINCFYQTFFEHKDCEFNSGIINISRNFLNETVLMENQVWKEKLLNTDMTELKTCNLLFKFAVPQKLSVRRHCKCSTIGTVWWTVNLSLRNKIWGLAACLPGS